MTTRLKIILVLCLFSTTIAAQRKEIKFGKITAEDFTINSPVVDSNTNAVILADVGSSEIDGNNKGWFSLIHKRIRRVKLLNKKGFDEATVVIPLYKSGGDEEKLDDLKAVTYNLEGGNVVQTKLDAKSVFKEKYDKNYDVKKFTFPNIKEGSIIEYTYRIESEWIQFLRSWEFQGDYPRLYTQYTTRIPEFFVYVFLSQGYFPLKNEKKDKFKSYVVSNSEGAGATERHDLSGYETENIWYAYDVPALKEEPFTSTIDNHISKIDFQISRIQLPPPNVPKDVLGNWAKVSDELLKHEQFGNEINRPNIWLEDDIKNIIAGATTDFEKSHRIYDFVRDNISVTKNTGYILPDNTTLREVFKRKNGSLAEVNLLLIAMLRHAKLQADPVLISTKNHGWAHSFYPLMSKYNYVLCRAFINGKHVYLDPSQKRMGFGRLSPELYNGPGFVVKTMPDQILLEADSLKESKSTLIFLVNNDKKGLMGSFSSTLGYYESTGLREKLAKTTLDDFLKEAEKGYSFPMKLEDKKIDSLDKLDFPLALKYKMSMNFDEEEIIYFNPMFSEGTKTNPFTSAERKYPVEMPFKMAEIYVLNMEVPKGYTIDEIPKSVRVKLNDNEGVFEYIVNATAERIMLQSKIDIKKANFAAEDYQTLRDFFGHIAKKHSEQIVFKKIKQ